jgi:hypothetical protein
MSVAAASGVAVEEKEFFPSIKPVVYNPDAAPEDVLVFRHYKADVRVSVRLSFSGLNAQLNFLHLRVFVVDFIYQDT